MQTIEITYTQMIMIGMGIGLVLGLIPLILGLIKGKKKLAILGFAASIAAGAMWSLLSLVTVIAFIWLILRKPSEIKPVEDKTVDEKPFDATVEEAGNSADNKIPNA